MPQISKCRIVNFQYNDGKRMIADELYDFANCEDKNALNVLITLPMVAENPCLFS